jgi:hypothetical protein
LSWSRISAVAGTVEAEERQGEEGFEMTGNKPEPSCPKEEASPRKPIVPEVCDRLKCDLPCCYGWDLCREAREGCTKEERHRWLKELWK